jgi:hypothetical protein
MSDTILASIITAFITALATATFTYLGYWRQVEVDLKKEFASRFNEQKWKAYQDFMIMQSRMANAMKPESAEVKIALLLVASDEVIKAYNQYVSLSFQEENREKRHKSVAKMIAEMRKDLGYDSKVNPDDLWTMFESICEK